MEVPTLTTLFTMLLNCCLATQTPSLEPSNASGDLPQSQSETVFTTPDLSLPNNQNQGLGFDEIMRFYGGLFLSESDMSRDAMWVRTPERTFWTPSSNKRRRHRRATNNACCQTIRRHRHDRNIVNVHGQSRDIVHMTHLTPSKFQWYPHVTCVSVGERSCRSINTTLKMLVHSNSRWPTPFEFDSFEIPSSCTCA